MDALLCHDIEKLNAKEWEELLDINPRKYVRDIRVSLAENNRFFVESRFIKLMVWCTSSIFWARKNVQTGEIFYRARIFEKQGNIAKASLNTTFHGYNKEESHAPPLSAAKEGRANPENIVYLYMAMDKEIAIAETSPNLGDVVSVAEIEVLTDLTLLDLRGFPEDYDAASTQEMWLQAFLSEISSTFQTPYHRKFDYLFCQYVSELAKNLGMDGIAFYSSKVWANSFDREMGTNLVVFDRKKGVPISSDLYVIKNILIDYYPLTKPFEKKESQ